MAPVLGANDTCLSSRQGGEFGPCVSDR